MRRADAGIGVVLVFVGTVLAGCFGGFISTLLFQDRLLFATETPRLPSVTSAEEFRLVDQNGMLRAILGLSADGQPYLAFLDGNETRRVWIGIGQESGLAVRDIDGKTRLVLSVDRDGEPSLVVRDRQHQSRIFQP
jgi:hypothetical protein